eukprot:TRINITY_DN59427_c0_g1_i1.p3 TRINITY_DN59427_c0_g1~~TRINITY_DN59427_c0_g1_i1.p3  ORF type:complete len:103 (-),score=35.61 TRINITY_DN59427_c0_g1_i1:11-295(-)
MLRSLVGSEMCIRDRVWALLLVATAAASKLSFMAPQLITQALWPQGYIQLDGVVLGAQAGRILTAATTAPPDWAAPVSYTHLTLPTKRIVENSG